MTQPTFSGMPRSRNRLPLPIGAALAGLSLFLFALTPRAWSQSPRQEILKHRQMERAAARTALYGLHPASPADQLASNQTAFDVTYYGLHLNISTANRWIDGDVQISGRSAVDTLSGIELDFYANMSVDSIAGDAASFSRQGNTLFVQLGRAAANGGTFDLQIYYSGRPASDGFGGFVFDQQNGQPLVWTLSEPYFARSWWPCKDTPADKADSVDLVITVPTGLKVASNGALRSEIDNGDGTSTFHWHEHYPITTYLVSLAITNYETFSQWFHYSPTDSMEMRHYIYPARIEQAKAQLADLVDMIRYFHETFGPYPYLDEKYGIAQFGWGGGMEHQTMTSQGSFGDGLTVHELSHQWWGDMITTKNWSDIWLNEGFASYSEALYFEHRFGNKYYHSYMASMDRSFDGSIYRQDTTSVGSIFNGIVYDKGAWVLHMLRRIVGDSTFFRILRAYGADPRFKHGNATTDGFVDVCETLSGQTLNWFFDPWIYGTGRPFYQYSWRFARENGRDVLHLRIKQAQFPDHQLFAMPIEVYLDSPAGDTTITIYCNAELQEFVLPVPFRPEVVKLDKDGWILKNVLEMPSDLPADGSPITDFVLKQNYPNPFNGETTIEFVLQQRLFVELSIFNAAGQLVRQLAAQDFAAGLHRQMWDGRDDLGQVVSSGVYVYQLRTPNQKENRKLVFMK